MEPDAVDERLYERADWERDEMQDRAWERALKRDAGPWDEVDAFSLAKEHEFFEEQREASESPPNALTSVSGTESHHHDSNAPQGTPSTKETP